MTGCSGSVHAAEGGEYRIVRPARRWLEWLGGEPWMMFGWKMATSWQPKPSSGQRVMIRHGQVADGPARSQPPRPAWACKLRTHPRAQDQVKDLPLLAGLLQVGVGVRPRPEHVEVRGAVVDQL